MIVGSIARRYAKALLSIGIEARTFEALGREVERLGKSYKDSAELREALTNPVFPMAQRQHLLEELGRRLALSRTTQHFAQMLLSRGRISYVSDIARELRALVDAQANRVRATVTSARPLDIAAEVRIKASLEKATGKTVILEKREDATLLGGVVTQIGDVVYDGSLLTQLNNLRQSLL